MSGFDRVARIYQALEVAAFGRTLQRARTAYVNQLANSRDVLILGDGDGRFLQVLLCAAPHARVHSVDGSARMLQLAASRLSEANRSRVTFECADARHFTPNSSGYDAVATLFFLDCFSTTDVRALISRLSQTLHAEGQWLFADFAIPPRGFSRLYATVVVAALYLFFRWRAGLEVQQLPPSEQLLVSAGFQCRDAREFRGGLIRSAVYVRSESNATSSSTSDRQDPRR